MNHLAGTCDHCAHVVTYADGVIWIDHNAITRHRAALTEWNLTTQPEPYSSGADVAHLAEVAGVAAAPPPVPWRVSHAGCVPDHANAYCLDFPHTHAQLLTQVAHLETKTWFAHTAIGPLLRELAESTHRLDTAPAAQPRSHARTPQPQEAPS